MLELAALDVFGLLDDYDSALYTRSFHDAPATVQDELRQLQADIASDESLLTDEVPPPELRERVLKTVAQAIELDNTKLAPLASIGRVRPPAAPTSTPQNGRSRLMQTLFGGSGQFWRAACFVLAGALIVLAYFWADAQREAKLITSLAIAEITSVQLEQEIGPTAKDFILDKGTRYIVLSPVVPVPGFKATILLHKSGEKGLLVMEGLPATEGLDYSLTVTDADGTEHEVTPFRSRGRLSGVQLSLAAIKLGPASIWTISSTAGPLLRS